MHMNHLLLVILGLAMVFSAHAERARTSYCKNTRPTMSFCETWEAQKCRAPRNYCSYYYNRAPCMNGRSFYCVLEGKERRCRGCDKVAVWSMLPRNN